MARAYRLLVFLAALAISKMLVAQPAFLIEDLDPETSRWSAPHEFTPLGTTLFSLRDDGLHGLEIWKSDGTEPGTTLLVDLCPGTCSSMPSSLTVSNGVLFFVADDGARGFELWKSDGTASGTVLVKDIRPEPGLPTLDDSPSGLLDIDGVLYFAANDGSNGQELWRSDGTTAGTTLVKDINPGLEGSRPRPWAASGGILLLNAEDDTHGREPWVSDGTEAGTVMVKDIHPGMASSSSETFPDLEGRDAIALPGGGFVFRADDGTHGPELWTTTGTEAGTSLLKDIHPTTGSSPTRLAALGLTVFFAASDGTNGTELWKTDGTEAGTILVKDISPGNSSSLPREITASGGRIFFRAFDETHGTELWLSDGTEVGTVLVKDVLPGIDSGLELSNDPPQGLTPFETGILFFANLQLWRSDGTEAGTVQVSMLSFLNQPALSFPFSGRDSWAVAGSLFFFSTTGGSDQEPNFWTSDGTTAGTLPILLAESPASSIFPNLDFLRGEHFFAEHGSRFVFEVRHFGFDEIWTSDATSAGTTALEGPTFGGGHISDLTALSGGLLFFRNQGALYQTDGTPAGTGPTSPGPVSLRPREITAMGSFVVFSCDDQDSTVGGELCRSNGTPVGTGLVKEIRPGTDGSFPQQLTTSGGVLYFNADDGTAGRELWTSDGTEAGTELVRDLWIGGDSSPDRLIDVTGTLFFSATTAGEGRELWKTDGTEAGTVLVKDIRPGSDSSIEKAPHWGGFTAAVGGTLFFVANDGVSGTELWKSDGTAAGTVLVKDIAPGSLGSGPFWLTRVSNRVYFAADNGVHGRELWVTDGTTAGTRMVADLYPGSRSSTPQNFQAVGHILVFAATDGVHGLEAWRSNGVAAGTRMLQDIAPGALPSSPAGFTPAGAHVFFAANDAATGMEPWAIPRPAVLATFGDAPTSYWAYPFVEALASHAITSGCGGGNYCPESTLNRAQMAVFILVGAHGPSYVPPPATGQVFSDVSANSFAASWIEQFKAEGYTAGCGDGKFCPNKPLSRAEAAVFLLLLRHGVGYAPPPATGLVFTDVPISNSLAPWIEQLYHEGITGGCGGGKYCPTNPVTRAQMAVFLSVILNLPLGQY